MTTAPPAPAPTATSHIRPTRRVSKVEQSRQVLLGTGAIVSAVLVLWMLLAPAFAPARRPPYFLAASLGAPASRPELSAVMAADGKALAGRARASTEAPPGRAGFQQALDDLLARRGGTPIVIYLSVVGASGPSDAEGTRAYVITADGTSGARGGFVSVADLIGPLQESKGPPKLLILDPGPVGSDRELGVFGNSFLAQLAPLLRRDGNLAVLTACAPGQVSWIAEPDHRSVFAHFVAEGLSGKGARWSKVTVRGLHRYVRAEVARWARRHRDAAQTPLLLGNDALDFTLPRFDVPPRSADIDPKQVAEIRDSLKARWAERAALAATKPYRHAPLAWRGYDAALLNAERLLRAGDPAGASKALDAARSAKARVEAEASGPQHPRPHSLALAESWHGGEASAARVDTYRRAIDRALGASGDVPKNSEESRPATETKPSEPAPEKEKEKATEKESSKEKSDDAEAKTAEDAEKPAKPAEEAKPAKPAKPPAEPKPERPKPTEENPAGEELAAGSADGTPTYVEGQLALWYSNFAARGGESDALRAARLNGMRRALAARAKAERAAADERAVPWVRDLVDEGDRSRREAQDRLFAAESGPFKDATPRLASAEALYDRAASAAAQCRRALDLVQRLEDQLPDLGEWQARRPDGMDETLEALLTDGAELARILAAGPGREGAEDARRRLGAATEKAEQGLARLEGDFQAAVDRALGRSATPSARELDALLRVPDIAPDDRLALLDRLAATAPAAVDEPLAASTEEEAALPDPDPSFWRQARAFARLEAGLFRLAGFDVQDLDDWQAQAWSARERNPELAFESFNRISARVRELRAQVVSDSRGPATSSDSEGPAERPAREAGRDLSLADRAARILPASLASRLSGDPPRKFDEYLLQNLLVWHGRRLDDDFAPEHAERILEDARRFGSSQALWDELGRARKLAAAALTVTGPGTGTDAAAHREITLRVGTEGDVPPGEAAVLLGHDPTVALRTNVAAPGSLIDVPTDSGKPASRNATVRPVGPAATARLDLAPGVFYRGRVYTAEKIILAEQDDVVRVEIRQQVQDKKHPDLFVRNAGKGYLHTLNSLDYKLVITNLTDRPVDAMVNYALEGLPADEARIHLDPKKSVDNVKGRVYPADVADNKARLLTVNVTEAEPDGRSLCKPFVVPFRKVHPKEFILADPGHGGGHFFVWVSHLDGTDPVPLPAEVLVKVEPANAFQEVGSSYKLVPHGRRARFLFRIIKPVDTVKWTVKAEGVENVHSGEFQMETGRPLQAPGGPIPQ